MADKNNPMMTNFTPRNIEWREKEKEVLILWGDGHKTTLPFLYLRKNCPCASCREERANQNPFKIIQHEISPKAILPKSMSPVGNYAIKIHWGDGHALGIYTFEILRQLCFCELCKG